MLTKNQKFYILFSIILLSGCMPSQEMVDRAQATANRALFSAEQANIRADNAEMASEAAKNAVKEANEDYAKIIEQMERMFQKTQEK